MTIVSSLLLVLVIAGTVPPSAFAQVDEVLTPPPNLVIPNYYGVPVGPFGALEGSAFIARIGDPSATWFNPAGLARLDTAQISGSAGIYQRTAVTPQSLPNQGGSIQQLPNFVGFTFAPSANLTVGAALLTSNAWRQETDSELITPVTNGQERFAYSADSEFDRRVLALGAGYHAAESPWRLGGGLAFTLMSLRLVESASESHQRCDRPAVASRLGPRLRVLAPDAGAGRRAVRHGRLAAGRGPPHAGRDDSQERVGDAGWRPRRRRQFGRRIGLRHGREHRVPPAVGIADGGAAYVRDRVELEVDLQAFSQVSTYSLISSNNPAFVYGDAGAGKPPIVSTQPFRGLNASSDAVVNFSAGGHVRLLQRRDLRLHSGVSGNRSPVNADDTIFSRVDLLVWTVGLSGSFGKFEFAAGVNRQTGTSNDLTLRNLLNGQTVRSSIDVSMTGFIYSLAYHF